MFPSPDLGNICIVNKSWEPRGIVVRIYNLTMDRFVAERRLPHYSIQDGCWVGDRILLSLYPTDEVPEIEPLTVLSATDLSTISFEDPYPSERNYNFRDLIVSPSGDAIIARGQEFLVLDSLDYKVLHHYKDDYDHINAVAWSPDGQSFAAVGRRIWIYDLEKGTNISTQSSRYNGYQQVFWSANGSWLYVMASGEARIFDIEADEFIQEEFFGHDVECWWPNLDTDEMVFGDGTELGISKLEDLSPVTRFHAAVEQVEVVIWDHSTSRIVVMTDKGVMRIFLDGNNPQTNQPPEIEILRPTEGQEVMGDITAEGTVTDDELVVFARYRLNDGGWTDLANPIYWSVDLSLVDMVEGDNTLTVSASDGEHTTIRSVTFHVSPDVLHNDPPTVTILTPEEGNEVEVLIEVVGTASDDHGVTMVLVRIGEGKWALARGTTDWAATLVVPSSVLPGQVTIEARSWDDRLFSQVMGVNVTLVLDGPSLNDRPKVTIESPTEGEVILGDVTIKGRTDDDSDVVTTLVAIDGGPLETLTTKAVWEKGLSNLGPGEHSVTVLASDGLLVSGVETVNFTLVDYEQLRVIISSPEDGAEVFDEVLVSGVVLGGLDVLGSVEMRFDGGEWTEMGPGRSWQLLLPLDGKEPGKHLIEVRAWDAIDTSKVANVTFVRVTEEEGPQGPREPDSVYIWLLLVVVTVFIIAVWRARQSRSP